MATSKTLTPTNVTISIPAMSDLPDASVFSNCVDKEADAINNLEAKVPRRVIQSTIPKSGSVTIQTVQNSFGLVITTYGNPSAFQSAFIVFGSNETPNIVQLYKGTNISIASNANQRITLSNASSGYDVYVSVYQFYTTNAASNWSVVT